MKVIDIQDLAIPVHKIEAIQLIWDDNIDMIKIFTGTNGHIIYFETHEDACSAYDLMVRQMEDLT